MWNKISAKFPFEPIILPNIESTISPQFNCSLNKVPGQCFELFFSHEVIHRLIKSTNKKAFVLINFPKKSKRLERT